MQHWLTPFIFAATFTGILAYHVEVLNPYIDAVETYELQCIEKGGMVYEPAQKPKMCVKTETIKIE